MKMKLAMLMSAVVLMSSAVHAGGPVGALSFYEGSGTVYHADGTSNEYTKLMFKENLEDNMMKVLINIVVGDETMAFGHIIKPIGNHMGQLLNFDNEVIGSGYCTLSADYRVCHHTKTDFNGFAVEETCQMHLTEKTVACMGSASENGVLSHFWHDFVAPMATIQQ